MDDIRPKDLPDGPPASEGVQSVLPAGLPERRSVGPESEVRGGPEAPEDEGSQPADRPAKG